MKIAICDDEAIYRETLLKEISNWSSERGVTSVLVSSFHSSEDLLYECEKKQAFDALFLDIQMPDDIDGLDLATRVRAFDECTQIIFVTNFSEYACQGYHVNALRYLCKPILTFQLYECLDIVYGQYRVKQGEQIILRNQRSRLTINYNNILFVEVKGHNLLIHNAINNECLTVRMTLNEMMCLLPCALFVKCHRSFVVNVQYIRRITRDCVYMADGNEITMSKQYRVNVSGLFDSFHQGISL